jgi:hypothetical protein
MIFLTAINIRLVNELSAWEIGSSRMAQGPGR